MRDEWAPETAETRGATAGAPRTRRWLTLAAGWTLLFTGAALLVLPGPGIPLLFAGLALLGREVAWARRAQARLRAWLHRFGGRAEPSPR